MKFKQMKSPENGLKPNFSGLILVEQAMRKSNPGVNYFYFALRLCAGSPIREPAIGLLGSRATNATNFLTRLYANAGRHNIPLLVLYFFKKSF